MMSAGLIGSPGLGYAKDRFSGEVLEKANPAIYATHKAATPSQWLVFSEVSGIDGKKLTDAKAAVTPTPEQKAVVEADIEGNRQTLKVDSFIPATMAVIYLLLFLYFKSIGGYKVVHLEQQKATA